MATAASSASTIAFTVSGKTAIVTGAGSGINLAFAELLLSRNCNVVFADISLRPEAKDLISRYENEQGKGPRAVWVETDVTSWPALAHMFERVLTEFGSFDIVCPGAGVWPSRIGCIPARPQDPPSHNPKWVIHISSIAGQLPVFTAPLYGASKAAISGFVRCLAPLEDAFGVRVNVVAPGVVHTPLWTEYPDKLANVDPSRDAWVTPQEVAEAMLSCVESETYVGGTVLEVGAGSTRQVKVLNDPGPDRRPEKGMTTSNASIGKEEVQGWLLDSSIWGAPHGTPE